MQPLQVTATPDELAHAAEALLGSGRLGAARPVLAALSRLQPAAPRNAVLAARLAIRAGCPRDALPDIDGAVAANPADADLRKCRAELRLLLDDRAGAAADAAEAVVLDPADPVAKAMLGVVLTELGRPVDAMACLREAVIADPRNPAYRQALAAAQQASGDPTAAAGTLAEAVAAMPRVPALRTASLLLATQSRRFAEAVILAEAACRDGVADACTFGLLGHALSSLGRHAEASEAYAEALKLGPEDPYVRHLVSASGAMPAAGQAPLSYLRAVFDGCAATFETQLLGLGYRVPGLLRAALLRHLALPAADGEAVGPVLDLGCGTGLMAVVVSDLPLGPITGVDASPGMLALAAGKGLYAELAEADVIDTLRRDGQAWRVMLAADLLCYFGALDALFCAAFVRLQPGGLFLFSVERTPGGDPPLADLPASQASLERGEAGARGQPAGRMSGDWVLGPLGRYAHDPDYVLSAARAAGFSVIEARGETLRREAGAPVAGLVVVLERRDKCSQDGLPEIAGQHASRHVH
jgi:predicted TPR repeat methyltransferase